MGYSRIYRIVAGVLVAGLLAVPCMAQEEKPAKNVTKQCTYTLKNARGKRENVCDNRVKSSVLIPCSEDGMAHLSVKWKDKVPATHFYLQWERKASAHRREWFAADGTPVYKEEVEEMRRLDQWIAVPEGARRLEISAAEPMEIAECGAYGRGSVPAHVHVGLMKDTPEKLDYLVVSAHPDDDLLFMGAVVPVSRNKGYEGTVLYMTCRERRRYEEALSALRTAGLDTLPLFLFKKDGGPAYKEVRTFWDFDETVAQLAACFREFRPEVVVTHDESGEYGHALHRITSEAVSEAVIRAADPAFDPGSYERFGAWQVKKLYKHLYPENRLQIDMREPLEAYGGKNALEVAREAYKEHKSQQYLWFGVSDTEAYSAAEYGLAFTAVGQDTPGVNDMFEHVSR